MMDEMVFYMMSNPKSRQYQKILQYYGIIHNMTGGSPMASL